MARCNIKILEIELNNVSGNFKRSRVFGPTVVFILNRVVSEILLFNHKATLQRWIGIKMYCDLRISCTSL